MFRVLTLWRLFSGWHVPKYGTSNPPVSPWRRSEFPQRLLDHLVGFPQKSRPGHVHWSYATVPVATGPFAEFFRAMGMS
jgi:hypothetical protein